MSTTRYRLPRVVLFVFVGTQAMGIGVIISLLADIQDRFGFPTWSLGLIAGTSFAFTLVAHLWLASFADRGWERPMIVIGGVLAVLALLWMVVASDLWHWVAARSLLGFAEGICVVAGRRLMLSWDPGRQGRALSSLTMALMIGFLLGPPVGGFLNEIDKGLPFLVPAVVEALLLPFVIIVKPGEYARALTRLSRRRLAAIPGLVPGLLLAASPWLMIGMLDSLWARYMTDLGASPAVIGVGFLALALPSVFVTPLSGRLADRVNPIRLALAGALVELPLVAAFGFATGVPYLLVVGALHSASWSFVTPPGQAAVAKVAPPGQAAEAQGLIESYGLSLATIGALAAPAIYDIGGPVVLFPVAAGMLAITPAVVAGLRKGWRSAF
ncbi:MAG: MFS transporter [bacterium]|nr:MFS transporter [bacterium]